MTSVKNGFKLGLGIGLGIIAAIVIILVALGFFSGFIKGLSGGSYSDSEKRQIAEIQIESIATALRLYKLDNGTFPDFDEGLSALVQNPGGLKNWRNGGYLEKYEVPLDPWGYPYIYLPSDVDPYDLRSFGADGIPDGFGEDEDIIFSH